MLIVKHNVSDSHGKLRVLSINTRSSVDGAPGQNQTDDLESSNHPLYSLSYGRKVVSPKADHPFPT